VVEFRGRLGYKNKNKILQIKSQKHYCCCCCCC